MYMVGRRVRTWYSNVGGFTCVYTVCLRVCTWYSNVCIHVGFTCVYMMDRRVCTWYSNVCIHGGFTCVYMVGFNFCSIFLQYTTDERSRRSAMEKLKRWGFNPLRNCRLTDVCKHLLVRVPPYENDVFPGLDMADRMHGIFMLLHRVIRQTFIDMHLSAKMQLLLDQRIAALGLLRALRDPATGKAYRVLRSIFSERGMKATDKVCMLFYLPHVLGHDALCLPEDVRIPILNAIASAQLVLIAVRGLRSFTKTELHEIFVRGYVRIFRGLELIHARHYAHVYQQRMNKHLKNPDKYQRPQPFRRTSRCDT